MKHSIKDFTLEVLEIPNVIVTVFSQYFPNHCKKLPQKCQISGSHFYLQLASN